MGHKDLSVLGAPVARFCRLPREALKACLDLSGDLSCAEQSAVSTKCEQTVQKAYRHINMGGCPYQIQSVTICEVEWCGKETDIAACSKECKVVRETLDVCVKRHVHHFLQRFGMTMDGTEVLKGE